MFVQFLISVGRVLTEHELEVLKDTVEGAIGAMFDSEEVCSNELGDKMLEHPIRMFIQK